MVIPIVVVVSVVAVLTIYPMNWVVYQAFPLRIQLFAIQFLSGNAKMVIVLHCRLFAMVILIVPMQVMKLVVQKLKNHLTFAIILLVSYVTKFIVYLFYFGASKLLF